MLPDAHVSRFYACQTFSRKKISVNFTTQANVKFMEYACLGKWSRA